MEGNKPRSEIGPWVRAPRYPPRPRPPRLRPPHSAFSPFQLGCPCSCRAVSSTVCLRAFALAMPASQIVLLSPDISVASLLLPACLGGHTIFLEGRPLQSTPHPLTLSPAFLALPPDAFFAISNIIYAPAYWWVVNGFKGSLGGRGSDLGAEGEGGARTTLALCFGEWGVESICPDG